MVGFVTEQHERGVAVLPSTFPSCRPDLREEQEDQEEQEQEQEEQEQEE